MSNRNLYRKTVIDGLELTLHSVKNVISSPDDLYTCILPIEFDCAGTAFDDQVEAGLVTAGATIKTTEVTHGIEKMHLQSRIESPYFRKALFNWFSGPDFDHMVLPPDDKDIDAAISQLAYAIRSVDEADLDLGRLYGEKQHMFAKLEFNNAWSLVMHNRRAESSGLDVDFGIDKKNGPWGAWTIQAPGFDNRIDGSFQLVHKNVVTASIAGTRIPFIHGGKIAHESQIKINTWFRNQFFKRWGQLLSTEVMETLRFKFDDSCIAEPFKDATQKGWDGMEEMLVDIGMFPPTMPVEGEQVMQHSDIVEGRELYVDNEWCLIELVDTDPIQDLPWLKQVFIKDSEGRTRPIIVGENASAEHAKSTGHDFSSLKFREKPTPEPRINKEFGEG